MKDFGSIRRFEFVKLTLPTLIAATEVGANAITAPQVEKTTLPDIEAEPPALGSPDNSAFAKSCAASIGSRSRAKQQWLSCQASDVPADA